MASALSAVIWFIVLSHCQPQNKTPIKVYQLAINTSHIVGQSIINAVSIAINEINDRQDILPNYQIQIETYDYQKDNQMAIQFAKYITQQQTNKLSDDISLTSPLILGPPWSSTSRNILPILNAYNFGLLSSYATSKDLDEYPYFYRTVPDERIQTNILLRTCKHFNWDKIGILYLHNTNGGQLNQLIIDQAVNVNDENFTLDITSIPYYYENIYDTEHYPMNSIRNQIIENNIYIVILIASYNHIPLLITELGGYPMYFIGVDWWMESNVIQKNNFTKYVQGYIGTYPVYPNMYHRSQFIQGNDIMKSKLLNVYNKSNIINEALNRKWNSKYNKSIYANYGYDAAYALAHALDIFDKQNGLNKLSFINSSEFNMNALHQIIIENVSFIGSTGLVSFDSNGNRMNAMYGMGYVSKQGSIENVALFIDKLDSNINDSTIIWPSDFQHIPYPIQKVYKRQITIKSAAFWVVVTICILSTAFIVYYMVLINYTYDKLIRNAWYGNIIVCIGCLFGYIAIVSYGIENLYVQPNYKSKHPLLFNIFCNFHIWILPIVFTLIYVPLFVRSYSLASIIKQAISFNRNIEIKILRNRDLYIMIFVCVLIDVLLLLIFSITQIIMNKYMYSLNYATHNREFVANDPMIVIEYKYPVCECNKLKIAYLFYGSVAFYKCFQLIIGIIYSLQVFRIKSETSHHYETKWLLVSIFMTIILIAISAAIISAVEWDPSDLTLPYILISCCIILVMNTVLYCNTWPRLCAWFRGKGDEYALTAEQQLKRKCIEYMESFMNENNLSDEIESNVNHGSDNTSLLYSHVPSNQHDIV